MAVVEVEVVLSGAVGTATNAKLAAFFASGVPVLLTVRSEVQAPEDDEQPRESPGGVSTVLD